MSFLLDEEGKVLEVFTGWSNKSESKIKALLGVNSGEGETPR